MDPIFTADYLMNLYQHVDVAIGCGALLLIITGFYAFVPNFAPTTWKRYVIHVSAAAIVSLPAMFAEGVWNIFDNLWRCGLIFIILVLVQSQAFARRRATHRSE